MRITLPSPRSSTDLHRAARLPPFSPQPDTRLSCIVTSHPLRQLPVSLSTRLLSLRRSVSSTVQSLDSFLLFVSFIMASSNTVVYFITGTNRGIGYAVVQKLAARPNTLVFATARDPSKANELQQLAKQHKNLRLVKLSVLSDEDHKAAAKLVEAEAGRVDVVLANAGIANDEGLVRTDKLSVDQLRQHFETNTIGPVRLFDAFFPLLNRSANPKFVVVSTAAGSIAYQAHIPSFPTAHYGASKVSSRSTQQSRSTMRVALSVLCADPPCVSLSALSGCHQLHRAAHPHRAPQDHRLPAAPGSGTD